MANLMNRNRFDKQFNYKECEENCSYLRNSETNKGSTRPAFLLKSFNIPRKDRYLFTRDPEDGKLRLLQIVA